MRTTILLTLEAPRGALHTSFDASTARAWRWCAGAYCFILVKFAVNDFTHVIPPSFEYHSSY